MDQLGKEGMVKRFEFCMELAWKTLKDYLEHQGVVLPQITPGAVLKEAVAAKLIDNGEDWMAALDARNKMGRTYDLKHFETVVRQISQKYLECFRQLFTTLVEKDRQWREQYLTTD